MYETLKLKVSELRTHAKDSEYLQTMLLRFYVCVRLNQHFPGIGGNYSLANQGGRVCLKKIGLMLS